MNTIDIENSNIEYPMKDMPIPSINNYTKHKIRRKSFFFDKDEDDDELNNKVKAWTKSV